MGHVSQIELWSPNLTTFCFAGFGTDRLRREEVMKTAGRENPNRCTILSSNRAHGAVGQNRSCSIKWAAKQEKFRPAEKCFLLTSTFIEPRTGHVAGEGDLSQLGHSLYGYAGLCAAASCRVAREDQRTGSAPAGGVLLPTTGCTESIAPRGAAGSARRV